MKESFYLIIISSILLYFFILSEAFALIKKPPSIHTENITIASLPLRFHVLCREKDRLVSIDPLQAKSSDWSNKTSVQKIFEKAAYWARDKCPMGTMGLGNIEVRVCRRTFGLQLSCMRDDILIAATNRKFDKLDWEWSANRFVEEKKRTGEDLRRPIEVTIGSSRFSFSIPLCHQKAITVNIYPPQSFDLSDRAEVLPVLEKFLSLAYEQCSMPQPPPAELLICPPGGARCLRDTSLLAAYKDQPDANWKWIKDTPIRLAEQVEEGGEVRELTAGRFLKTLDKDPTTDTQFWTYAEQKPRRCRKDDKGYLLTGIVPAHFNLLEDNQVKALVIRGLRLLREKCQIKDSNYKVQVRLVPDNFKFNSKVSWNAYEFFSPTFVFAETGTGSSIERYSNYILDQHVKKVEEEKKRARHQEIQKRFSDFVSKNSVQSWTSINVLSVNPFIYEGKTIGIAAYFESMSSATTGVFHQGSNYFVVSSVPRGLLTSSGGVLVAGSVLGKTELGLPIFGKMQVPHLKFVDVYICQEPGCTDIMGDKQTP